MPLIWCAISGHGFGHAAQMVPVLNELGRRNTSLKVLLRTTVPSSFFRTRLTVPWELSVQEQDVCCVQQGPLTIDVPATWKAYRDFHNTWDARLQEECDAIKHFRPDLVLSNISYLALDAGAHVGVPAIGFGSLSWDQVLQELVDVPTPEQGKIMEHIQAAYTRAELVVRLAPSLPMQSFPRHVDVGPIGHRLPDDLRPMKATAARATKGPLVLVALGGVPLDSLPFDEIDRLAPYQFLLDMDLPTNYTRLKSMRHMSESFDELFEAADIILSKPGYGTVIEAVAAGKPLVYVRRYNFSDEGVLADYAHRYGRAYELSKEEFYAGAWGEALDATLALSDPVELPLESGIMAAADIIDSYLSTTL